MQISAEAKHHWINMIKKHTGSNPTTLMEEECTCHTPHKHNASIKLKYFPVTWESLCNKLQSTKVFPPWTYKEPGTSEALKFIVFVSKLSWGYEAIFVLILFGKDILHHVLM